MNLSILERMVQDGDLSLAAAQYLLDCRGECEWLDYKQALALDSDSAIGAFARDVLAMKNTGGGYIVVGVEDKTWKPVGIPAELPYDSKLLRDKVRRGTGLELDVDIVHHTMQRDGAAILIAVLLIRSSRKRSKRRTPSLVKIDFRPSEKNGLRRGDIYARRGDSTIKVDTSEMLESLLSDLEDRADADGLEATRPSSPFAIHTGLYRLQAPDFEHFVGRSALRRSVVNAVLRDPRIWIINIHGPGGVGKSAIATWAAYHFFKEKTFESIVQLTAKDTVLTEHGIRRNYGRTLHSLEDLLDRICSVFEHDPPKELEGKKRTAIEILSAWSCLLILDNMETVADARIVEFIQNLPSDTKAKVILTSRHRTGGWEFPITVSELSLDEITEFVSQKAFEMSISLPLDGETAEAIRRASGGLPLAIQWILGQYRSTSDLKGAIEAVDSRSSPVLEFSFRNIWNMLSADARTVLAILSIFDDPPTTSLIAVAIEWDYERIESAVNELSEVTLVSRQQHSSESREAIVALPITLSFARNELDKMGDLEVRARRAVRRYTQQMELRSWEVERFTSIFTQYRITNDNEKRAAILCRRGESETFSGNLESARDLFSQARDLAPNSAYVFAMCANFELAAGRIGVALRYAETACKYANRSTGSLTWSVRARVADAERDRPGHIAALRRALDFEPDDHVLRHQLGVALSRSHDPEAAIAEFTTIIEGELKASLPSETLIMALNTRIINSRRLGRDSAADADLTLAHSLLARYPHLERQRRRIEDLDGD